VNAQNSKHLVAPYTYDNYVQSEDKITFYDINLFINQDRSVTVTENITINNGISGTIEHGIFRDFPTLYKNKWGLKEVVELEILEVFRNGQNENYVKESLSGGQRIKIGNENYYLEEGQHVYTIKYTMDKQIRSFEDTDELYFNLVGTGWEFNIDNIRAVINLPEGLNVDQTKSIGYSGVEGSAGNDFVIKKQENIFIYESTRSYAPKEGLTASISFPKGYVIERSNGDSLLGILSQNILVLIAFIVSVFVCIYYYLVWFFKGRDPYVGTVIPVYEPPQGLTSGQIRYLDRMGYDDKLLTATLVDMGVKGYLKIIEENKTFSLKKLASDVQLPNEQKILADDFFGNSKETAALKKVSFKIFGFNLNISVSTVARTDEIELSSVNSIIIQKAVSAVKSSLSTQFDKEYIHHNRIYLFVGIIINIIVVGLVVLQNFLQGNIEANGFIFFGLFWNGIVSIFIFGALIPGWITLLKSKQGGCSTLFLTVFLIPFIAVGLFMVWYVINVSGVISVLALFLPFPLHIVFYKALKARTKKGRELQNQIDGFKMFLGATEEERLKFFNKELPHTFETFQKYLPYAIALDLETEWTERFNDVISDYTTTHDSPGWYSGSSIGFANSSFASSMSSTLSSSISSSSSSGSSGGSSGGGGGGGGGGGW
jgi:uncharacterized membrane protein YgcG